MAKSDCSSCHLEAVDFGAEREGLAMLRKREGRSEGWTGCLSKPVSRIR